MKTLPGFKEKIPTANEEGMCIINDDSKRIIQSLKAVYGANPKWFKSAKTKTTYKNKLPVIELKVVWNEKYLYSKKHEKKISEFCKMFRPINLKGNEGIIC